MSTCVKYLYLLYPGADERRILNKVLSRVERWFIYWNNRHLEYRHVQGFDFKLVYNKLNPVFFGLQMISQQYTRKKRFEDSCHKRLLCFVNNLPFLWLGIFICFISMVTISRLGFIWNYKKRRISYSMLATLH